ncbi:assimilatory nitrate reductase electron transfer subunit [Streptomyces sp. 3211.6]|uniref:NAD(P)/FAD-dependent oxidoreductase n=1 Tax=Streptomyces TaxID=1883 RepID=UPI0009A4E882|nr:MULTISPECIES: FAD-dependent oxidoreductase [Streptomyces]RKT04613.1 assimilatory nitrate reductase electron transfer subunit [Streptomyces sp. 3211.6]RPF40489.1 assimilatory nitrate reductase electron transfer subunit [Streptomyces sp. Ag109_G2-6]
MTSKQRVVVIGGGLAGLRLAARLGPAAAVTVLGEESHAPYNRVLLAEVLAGRYAPEVAALPASGPVLRRGVRAVRIDRDVRRVHCDDGTAPEYDVLVLATGSNPVLPPLRGLFPPNGGELPAGVHAFRTMDDCLALDAAVRPGVRAVVIGGGLLGVSAARALAARGAQVVVAQQAQRLMERQLDADASALLREHLAGLGVEIHTECRVRGLTTTGEPLRGASAPPGRVHRRVTGVELADGYRLAADLVVLACGVRPRTGLARAAGLEVRKGVLVDDRLRTSDPYVHAIGDCAEHAGRLYGLAGPALEQADALAATLSGSPTDYTGTRALTRLTLGGAGRPLDLAAFGDPTPLPGDDVVRLADATRRTYRKVVLRGDRLVGGVLLGELSTVGALARTWEGDESLDAPHDTFHLLTDDGGH